MLIASLAVAASIPTAYQQLVTCQSSSMISSDCVAYGTAVTEGLMFSKKYCKHDNLSLMHVCISPQENFPCTLHASMMHALVDDISVASSA